MRERRPANISSTVSTPAKPVTTSAPFTFASYSIASEKHPEHNEDSTISDPRRGLAAVLDGVGGSAHGDIASQVAARAIRKEWKRVLQSTQPGSRGATILEPPGDFDLPATLERLLEDAHEQIHEDAARRVTGEEEPLESQATTVALAVFYRESVSENYMLAYAHVGDSRIYLLRADEPLKRLTDDDGYLSQLVRGEVVSEDDARRIDQATRSDELTELELSYFEKRNGITQALGDIRDPAIHTNQTTLAAGDRIILCTDGIHDNLTDHEIEEIVRRAPRTTGARRLVEQALQRSRADEQAAIRAKSDDMSAIVITCHFQAHEDTPTQDKMHSS
ncbi:MAG: serine/threonine-protein phosphatase [Ktedonobacteraceae bacterium]|nr:serine/threonine-protein phosphatase [Ktedonobacteraceae bacterium]